ncbi:right-handed parallel beta-helix repeat-containing protein [Verrucomicrobiaceae bacterium E54]|nr:right-handed parallel beta-helix repeat-containing protein [Verrucomicrobiaceae bacterium E54]
MSGSRIALFSIVISSGVTADDIYVNGAATTGSDDGSSWANAFLTLQDALASASAGDTVHVAEGVYFPDEGVTVDENTIEASFVVPQGVVVSGGYSGTGGERDPDSFPTILSGDLKQDDLNADGNFISETPADVVPSNSTHVVTLSAACELDGFIITGGRAEDGIATNGTHGGGLLATSASVVSNCRFYGNHCTGRGGAVMVVGAGTTFINCLFAGNTADARGGALGTLSGATPSLINCVFLGNEAERGGGLNFNDSSPTLTNCSISGNSGTINGGGIQAAANSVVTLENTIVWNNHAAGSRSSTGSSINLLSGSTYSATTSLLENDGGTDPVFVTPPNPSTAPSVQGDLRLTDDGSPAFDSGTDAANGEPTDVLGNDRVVGLAIDIGAYELFSELYVDGTAVGGLDNGQSWEDAFLHLRDALDAAGPHFTIHIAAGVHYPDDGATGQKDDPTSSFVLIPGCTLLGGYPNGGGPRDIENEVTVLSGDLEQNESDEGTGFIVSDPDDIQGFNAYHVLTLEGDAARTTLSGLTITGGSADDGTNQPGASISSPNIGGGLISFDSDLLIESCRFIGNRAYDAGGGAFLEGTRHEVRDCEFVANHLTGSTSGGGNGLLAWSADAGIHGCRFESNAGRSSTLNLGSPNGSPTPRIGTYSVTACDFLGNVVLGGSSGISVKDVTSAEITGCRFQAGESGVGQVINANDSDSVLVSDSLFSGNTGNKVISASVNIEVALRNCTLSGNDSSASTILGGISFPGATASIIRLENTVSWGNGTNGSEIVSGDSTIVREYSLIEGQPGGGNGNLDGLGGLDPSFVNPLPPTSAPTTGGDYSLLPASPLIEAGGIVTASPIDLAGNPRYFDADGDGSVSLLDIGAYEYPVAIIGGQMVRITDTMVDPANGQITLTVESLAATPYTVEYSETMSETDWPEGPDGVLTAGTNTVIVPGSAYGWPKDRVFLRLVTP